jgi:prevent-host-death family protein
MGSSGNPSGTVSAAEISRNFGDWQRQALKRPVTITHHGRPRFVLASVEAFEEERPNSRPHAESSQIAAQLRAVLNQMHEAFYAIDKDFKVIEVNAAAELYLGQTREALVGRDLRDAIPDTRSSAAWNLYERVMQTGEMVEFRIQSLVHHQAALQVRAFPYDGGGVGAIFSSMPANDGATVLRQRCNALLDALRCEPALGIAILNLAGGFEVTGDTFCDLSGYPREALRTLTLTELVAPRDRRRLVQALNETVREASSKRVETTLMAQDGSELAVRLSMSTAAHEAIAEEIVVFALAIDRLGRAAPYADDVRSS